MHLKLILLASLLAMSSVAADARWKPEYAQNSPEDQAWYARQQTTPETRARLDASWYLSCCDHSDTVAAKFTKDGGVWRYQLEGTSEWKDMPQDIVQPDVMTPHSRAILFIDATSRNFGPVCFFPGGAGT